MYSLIKPLLFRLEEGRAHYLALTSLDYLPTFCLPKPKSKPVSFLGMRFDHPVGLAAGLDKNGEHLAGLAKLGFSFLEIGTVTPRPQEGNPQPRLFRLPQAQALINRMGFNNQGVDVLVRNVQQANYQGILGINIGKNKDTPLYAAAEDYLYCLDRVYPLASYVTINISSPNTPELRRLQQSDYLLMLLRQIRQRQLILEDLHQRQVPLLVKISPDESEEALKQMIEVMIAEGIMGVIATNTTVDHSAVADLPHGAEQGGLSGRPLLDRSTRILKLVKDYAGSALTLIGAGGVDSPEAAREKMAAGADLLQLYTGLIYQGPGLVRRVVNGL